MKISQINSHYLIKTLDATEQKFHEAIYEKLNEVQPNDRATFEAIVQRVLLRLNEQLTNQSGSFGVLSVNNQSGHVRVTAESIQAEPAFNKNTAFNKNFGRLSGQVCEGNDPRLSDRRLPKEHTHTIEDLDKESLQEMIGQHEKVSKNELARHEHENKNVLDRLRYSGNKQIIYLDAIEDFAQYLPQNAENISNHMADTKIHITNAERESWNGRMTRLDLTQATEKLAGELKEYAEEQVQTLTDDVEEETNRSFSTLGGAQKALQKLEQITNSHLQSVNEHLSENDRSLIEQVSTKAPIDHRHESYLCYKPFTSLSEMEYQ